MYFCVMETLLVTAKDKNEVKLLTELFKKMKLESKVLNAKEKEDIVLLRMMEATDMHDTIPLEKFKRKLSK